MIYQKLLQKAQKEKSQLSQTIGTLIIFNSSTLVEGIRTRWLFGKSSDGLPIGHYSNNSYEANRKAGYKKYSPFKHNLNPKAGDGIVDLTLTGSLGENLKLIKKSNITFEVISTDWKFEKLVDQYGLKPFNMDQQQTTELFDMLYLMAMEQYFENVWGNV